LYPCGHGDIFPALTNSGLLKNFINDGGKYVAIVNVDNVLAALDPVLIGWHVLSNSNVTCEVVERRDGDTGGVLCIERGQLQIAEGFRLSCANPQNFKWLNTNSFIFNANLNIEPLGNSWNRVQKNVNDKLYVQHERLIQEITEAYDTMFVRVERRDRFFPIKNQKDLILASEKLNIGKLL
jgi:UTP--glucose-1-phosphate uridylyltransferase